MPKIRAHHHPDHPLASGTDYQPACAWPDDTTVQWGGGGLVLGKNPYTTAFFEAFPAEGGFIRGEGKTIQAAEEDAFAQFRRESGCNHIWGRRGYTNSGGKCIRCNAFQSGIFKEITKLGSWREPLSTLSISTIISGWLRPRPLRGRDAAKLAKHDRRTWLRARWHGIDLPPMPEEFMNDDQFMGAVLDPYRTACREAVAAWLQSERCTLDQCTRDMIMRDIEGHRSSDARLEEKARLKDQ